MPAFDSALIGQQRARISHALYGALDSESAATRCFALKALQKLETQDEMAGRKIVALLMDPDPDVRVDTATALGNLKFTQAITPLLKNIEGDPEGEVRIQATIALGKIASTDSLERLTRCIKKEGYPELDFPLDDSGFSSCWEVQRHALEAMGKINCPKASEDLREILQDQDFDYLRGDGYRVLLGLDPQGGTQFLLDQYAMGDLNTRIDAMRALGSSVRMNASQRSTLRKILFSALADDDARLRRVTVITAARHFATDSGIIRALPILLNDPDDEVRQTVLEKLTQFNSPALLEKLHALTGHTRPPRLTALIRLLGRLANEASAQVICGFLGHEDEAVRYAVLDALANIAVPVATEKLLQIVADAGQVDLLRLHAIRALAASFHLLDEGAEEPEAAADADQLPLADQLIKAFEAAVYDASERVSLTALSTLIELDPDRSENILLHYLQGSTGTPEATAARPVTDLDTQAAEKPISLEALMPHLPDEGNAQSSTLASIFHKAEPPEPQVSVEEPVVRTAVETAIETEVRQQPKHVELLAIRLLGGLSACSERAIALLLGAGAEEHLRAEVITTIGRLGDVRGLPLINQALGSEKREERILALDAMPGISPSADSTELLQRLAGDEDPVVREKALSLFTSIESVEATQIIAQGLQDADVHVCKAAVSALNPGNSSAATADLLLELLFSHGGELRLVIGAALQRIGACTAQERLLEILGDESADNQHWVCIDALVEMCSNSQQVA